MPSAPVVEDITEVMLKQEKLSRKRAEDAASAEVLRTLFQVSAQHPEQELPYPGKETSSPPKGAKASKTPRSKSRRSRTPVSKVPVGGSTGESPVASASQSRWWPDIKPGHNVKIRSSVFRGMRDAPVVPSIEKKKKPGEDAECEGEKEVDSAEGVMEKKSSPGFRRRPSRKPPWQPDPTPP